jgi:glutamate synthase (NADPH/NADH) small chain
VSAQRQQGDQLGQGNHHAEQLQADFDAVLLTGGSEQSRDLPVPGRDLDGIHFAMEFLPQQNKVNAGDKLKGQLRADGKHVIVIGGGDTGSTAWAPATATARPA